MSSPVETQYKGEDINEEKRNRRSQRPQVECRS
jgi:hypothetical protein